MWFCMPLLTKSTEILEFILYSIASKTLFLAPSLVVAPLGQFNPLQGFQNFVLYVLLSDIY